MTALSIRAGPMTALFRPRVRSPTRVTVTRVCVVAVHACTVRECVCVCVTLRVSCLRVSVACEAVGV